MNGIIIKTIKFQNFRQYGTGTINFSHKEGNYLSVFKAKNGTGKTTLLNAITWCLYEKEQNKKDNPEALPILNTDVLQNSNPNDRIPVSVSLVVNDSDELLIKFVRKVSIKVISNDPTRKDLIKSPSTFSVTITPLNKKSNTQTYVDDDALPYIKQYFDEDIDNFYFFDGEKLSEFFASDNKTVKDSIFKISQVSMLETARTHAAQLRTEKQRKLNKESNNIAADSLSDKITRLEQQNKSYENTLTSTKETISNNEIRIKEIDDLLGKVRPIEQKRNEQKKLESQLNKYQNDRIEFKKEYSAFIRNYICLLRFYKYMKKTHKTILEKRENGELPPSIDPDTIKKIIEGEIHDCPICGTNIDSSIINHLTKVLTEYTVSTSTSTFLVQIESSLEQKIKEAEQYEKEKSRLVEKEKSINYELERVSKELEDVNKYLEKFTSSDYRIDVSKFNSERNKLRQENDRNNRMAALTEDNIMRNKKEIEKCKHRLEEENSKAKGLIQLRSEVKILSYLESSFSELKEKIMSSMKDELQKTTWRNFDNMIWKTRTFGRIEIDDNYNLSVYNTDNQIMTDSISETEKTALAYAFILAIHKVSGKNSPLVIDSPLGRVSDKNRELMAELLLNVSKNKQIVMLFTPDEYSDSVSRIYNNVATIRDLELTNDEKYVMGLE